MHNVQQGRRGQQGMTFWGLSFVIGVLAFALFILFKLFPPYLEDFKVQAAFNSVAQQAEVNGMGKAEISTALYKRFDIDSVDSIKLEQDLTVEPHGRTTLIRLRYERVIPILGNLSILIEFDHAKEIRSGGQ